MCDVQQGTPYLPTTGMHFRSLCLMYKSLDTGVRESTSFLNLQPRMRRRFKFMQLIIGSGQPSYRGDSDFEFHH